MRWAGASQRGAADFPAAMVKQISSSSGFAHRRQLGLASGTLIWSNVLLAAGHSFQSIEPTSVEVLHRLRVPGQAWHSNGDVDENSGGSPRSRSRAGPKGAPTDSPRKPRLRRSSSTIIVPRPRFCPDRVEGCRAARVGLRAVALPRPPVIPRPGLLNGKQIAAVGHPWDKSVQAEPTQVMASRR